MNPKNTFFILFISLIAVHNLNSMLPKLIKKPFSIGSMQHANSIQSGMRTIQSKPDGTLNENVDSTPKTKKKSISFQMTPTIALNVASLGTNIAVGLGDYYTSILPLLPLILCQSIAIAAEVKRQSIHNEKWENASVLCNAINIPYCLYGNYVCLTTPGVFIEQMPFLIGYLASMINWGGTTKDKIIKDRTTKE